MNTASNAPVNALHFTEEMANIQDDSILEDLIVSSFPNIGLFDAEYLEVPYRQDGGDYVDIQLQIITTGVAENGRIVRKYYVLNEDDWMIETPEGEHDYEVLSDRKYRELTK